VTALCSRRVRLASIFGDHFVVDVGVVVGDVARGTVTEALPPEDARDAAAAHHGLVAVT
jgi:hypothetical protein